MNNKLQLAVVVILAALLSACSAGPEEVAERFARSLMSGDVEVAKKFGTPSTNAKIDLSVKMGKIKVKPDFHFIFVESSVDGAGKRAWIKFKDSEKGRIDTISLVQMDGVWKVSQ